MPQNFSSEAVEYGPHFTQIDAPTSVALSPRPSPNHKFLMQYKDLRDFIGQLEQQGELRRIAAPVSPDLEMTEICDRLLRAEGPAVLFEKPARAATAAGEAIFDMPVLANLFGTPRRVALGMGADDRRRAAQDRPCAGDAEGARAAQGIARMCWAWARW